MLFDGLGNTFSLLNNTKKPPVLQHGKSIICSLEWQQKLTLESLDDVIERIEIGHVTHRSKLGKVIQIYWKLK